VDISTLKGARKVAELPRFVPPQAATLVQRAPDGEDWLHEIKFDGYRALARIDNGSAEIRSRNDKDWTQAYAMLAAEMSGLPVENAILDGEVVVQLPDGTTSFEALRRVPREAGEKPRRSRGAEGPDATGKSGNAGPSSDAAGRLLYYAFDLLYLNGYALLDVPIEQRRRLLAELLARPGEGGRILFSEHIPGDGPSLLAKACALRLEGVVSKRASTPYRPGVRGSDWVKTKCHREQEFVIGGYTDPSGTRTGFGALLLGVYHDGRLRYVSKVGTGFDERLLLRLGARLREMEVKDPPFDENLPRNRAGFHWVRPELVAQVEFLEWTAAGGIRHPSFKGLREDKAAQEVTAEKPPRTRGGRPARG